MNLREVPPGQPKSPFDAPEPPWELSKNGPPEFQDNENPATGQITVDIHPDDKGIQIVDIKPSPEDSLEEVFPMDDEESDEPIEMPAAEEAA